MVFGGYGGTDQDHEGKESVRIFCTDEKLTQDGAGQKRFSAG